MEKILETERLILRKMSEEDLPGLRRILQDEEVMYAYEHAFSDEEVDAWFENQRRRYREDGFGLWAVIRKSDGEMVGQCGVTKQMTDAGEVLEVGYLFARDFWHNGYAAEAARACRDYAFDVLHADEVFSIIRDSNVASQRVAERNGMTRRGSFIKHYCGIDMPHFLYSIRHGER